ncbi:MAG: protein jag [Arachnia sp.]
MTETKAPTPTKPSAADETLLSDGDLVADYLEELLDIADLDGDIENSVINGRAHIVIDTDDERFVGKKGEVLEALQELCRLVVMTETGSRSRLTLDVAGYRERRRVELVAMAKDAIAEVSETGESVRMAPLNAYERKIVHDEVAAAGLVSESEGEPPHRRVIVTK